MEWVSVGSRVPMNCVSCFRARLVSLGILGSGSMVLGWGIVARESAFVGEVNVRERKGGLEDGVDVIQQVQERNLVPG
ncbi:hypothetical protein B0T16DRAFT_411248 [Cercophora newfieldiana]|uniref:Uncharacterized protein n=1 Tax=Cercophora newfieldiana TaxID=92897 RepID=A0AA40CQF3_9PEZI|nr:hypothetical protein B0T16DRAFT_411248 [Cercophora newfieldiana]